MPKTSKHLFIIYHPNYKDKFVNNLIWAFFLIAKYFYFLFKFGYLSINSHFTCNNKTIQPGLIYKKK